MTNNMDTNNEKFPKGHFIKKWTGLGIAIFSGIGIPLSIITDNPAFIGVGPAIGVALGSSIGQSIEKKYTREGRIRSLNDTEKRKQKIATKVGIAFLILGFLAFVLILIYLRK